MSRVANNPVAVPSGVEVKVDAQRLTVKGSKGSLELDVHESVAVVQEENELKFSSRASDKVGQAMSGTMRSLVHNMVQGVTDGYTRELKIEGVGYRAQVKGKVLNLSLGYSHPIDFDIPEGINIEVKDQTSVTITGIDKEKVGQTAANIRFLRIPEPYRGKGIRYSDEVVRRKAGKASAAGGK